MTYSGPERRIHKVFVTKNTEYHTKKNICVGVRSRKTGQWQEDHMAMEKELCGSIKFSKNGMRPSASSPKPGESLYFYGGKLDVVTSSLVSVERPPKKTVTRY